MPSINRAVLLIVLLISGSVFAAGPGGGGPSTPTGLTAPGSDLDGSYTVSWNQVYGATFYQLQEKIGAGSWSVIYNGSSTSTSFSKTVIDEYSYRVQACDWTDTCSSYSSSVLVDVTGGLEAPAQEETTSISIGNLPYGIDVATDGDSVISIPLQLTPGIAGFAPSLSLEYDSGRGIDQIERSLPEDTLGYGWRLAGISNIRRCVVDQVSTNSIQLNGSDSLCLDAMPLELLTGTNLAVGATYRTAIESFIKIEIKGSTGALWFEVKLPDGTVQEYGNVPGSRVDHNGGTDYQWSLGKSTSVDGNVIDYTYWFDPSKGINYPVNIGYAGANVDFEYLTRTDTSAVSIGSASQTQGVFLHTVRVRYYDSANTTDRIAREYRLIDEVVSSRRRLDLVQLCGYDESGVFDSCLNPLKARA